MDLTQIALVLLGMAFSVSVVWGRVSKVLNAFKELADLLTVTAEAIEDQDIDQDDMIAIKKEWREALAAFKAVIK